MILILIDNLYEQEQAIKALGLIFSSEHEEQGLTGFRKEFEQKAFGYTAEDRAKIRISLKEKIEQASTFYQLQELYNAHANASYVAHQPIPEKNLQNISVIHSCLYLIINRVFRSSSHQLVRWSLASDSNYIFLIAIIVILGALTFFPALALGPIVEHLKDYKVASLRF